MYKCQHNLYIVPDYISDIIPPLVAEVTNYPLRNRHNLANIYTRTEVSGKSCIPSAVSEWNNLSNEIRRLSVLHARIRNNCSDLNNDLVQNHLRNDPYCSCGNDIENAHHYFFECVYYNQLRIEMFNKTRAYHPLSLHTLLFGKSTLSDVDNHLLFQAVQQFIKDTRRF